MRRGRQAIRQVIDSVADGGAEIDWGRLEQQVSNERDLDLLRQLRVLSELSDFQRAEADRVDEAALKASAKAMARIGLKPMSARTGAIHSVPRRPSSETVPLRRWGRLELSERLGEGTFGEVYRAFDRTLEREVAVKLLHVGRPQARLARVLDEARALARVRHPNVVVVHDAEVHDGRVGLCMELIRGQTLSSLLSAHGRLGATEATSIGQALCRALAAVHNEGLLHRDIKAQNVMREEGGRVVLMDFGAGQRLERAGQPPPRLTGTPLYLAPELLAGGKATVQSDIYSLGVLLYHLVTNDYPVSGASLEELKGAHRDGRRTRLHDARPDLDDAIVAVVERAIDADATRRYQTAGELGNALGRTGVVPPRHGPLSGLGLGLAAATFLGAATVAIGVAMDGGTLRRWLGMPVDTRHVIAVLPLEHTTDVEDYVAADVTDSLSQALSAVEGVIVLSRTSVKAARQANASLPQLAESLGAQFVLEGRVSRAGSGLAASLNLVQAPRDQTLLARTFRFSVPAIERLQQDVLRAVCERLSIALDPKTAGRFGHSRSVRADARELYARARFELAKLTVLGRAEALEYFKRAIVADPEFALPYAGLAEAYATATQPGVVQESFELAERAAQQALALDPSLADAHAVLADIRMLRDWDWAMADAEFQKAIGRAQSADRLPVSRCCSPPEARPTRRSSAFSTNSGWIRSRRWSPSRPARFSSRRPVWRCARTGRQGRAPRTRQARHIFPQGTRADRARAVPGRTGRVPQGPRPWCAGTGAHRRRARGDRRGRRPHGRCTRGAGHPRSQGCDRRGGSDARRLRARKARAARRGIQLARPRVRRTIHASRLDQGGSPVQASRTGSTIPGPRNADGSRLIGLLPWWDQPSWDGVRRRSDGEEARNQRDEGSSRGRRETDRFRWAR